ncbi:hypothetical protein [Aliikangiella coralliicola]|uniref:Membrane-associated protein n=1 Tax=Aliikangiella coralliicola TaxID=2592383 RepID=A0A545UBW5_9GAMM|nr:hypothetical protein [Aliikangiella coralliicola]TQV86954.1 hypothetical protein FLL46_14175 [Aliikangiella coralliicola]
MENSKIPMSLKILYTSFMAVLVPFYWSAYGPSNFLYFCDIALFLTLVGIWREDSRWISMAAVGIIIPQMVWVADFLAMFFNFKLLGMTEYMFRDSISLFARSLSLFHGWLPFLLLYLLSKTGYHRKALIGWTLVAWAAMLVSYLFMPEPGQVLDNVNAPVNINYVYGFSETTKQQWLPDHLYLIVLMVVLPALVYWPTSKLLERYFGFGNVENDKAKATA